MITIVAQAVIIIRLMDIMVYLSIRGRVVKLHIQASRKKEEKSQKQQQQQHPIISTATPNPNLKGLKESILDIKPSLVAVVVA